MTGAELIAAERERQIMVEDFTASHDDNHKRGQLAEAAQCYIDTAELIAHNQPHPERVAFSWPWEMSYWKPSPDPIRNLVKAGALIAAEIDRLQRLQEKL